MDGRLGPMVKLPSGKWKILKADYERWLTSLVIDRRVR